MKKKKKSQPVDDYQPTEQEQAKLKKYHDRRSTETAPRIKVLSASNPVKLGMDHPDQEIASALLMEALGTTDTDFVEVLTKQLADSSDQLDEANLNFMFAVIKNIKAKDQLEAMLAAQMAVIHVTLMRIVRQLDGPASLEQQDSAQRGLNALARTFTTQMEALKRYRTGGEQKVTVQHVSVGEGGQAIVGNITQAAPKTSRRKSESSPLALTDARQPAMPIIGDRKRARAPLRRERKNDG